MQLFQAIAQRHSYRGPFKDQDIPRDDLKQIVQAGILAPSGCNRQTTDFVIIDSPEILESIRAMHPGSQAMQQARAYICCIVNKSPEAVYGELSFEVEDCAAATENMLLAITDLGYASVWVDGWLRAEGRAGKIGKLISLPAEKEVRIVLPVGVPAEPATPPAKKALEERAWFNAYGG